MKVLTHFISLELITIAADLDQGTGSSVEGGEFSAMRVLVSSKARSAVGLSHGSFSSVVVVNLTEELAIDFAQWARHVANGVLMLL